MPRIEGLSGLLADLKAAEKKAGEANVSVIVGYTQSYAIYVHEDLEAQHPVGQAKFLEQPARELSTELGAQIGEGVAKGMTMEQSLLVAGLRLQRESQQLVPVDTGALKNSAFTRKE